MIYLSLIFVIIAVLFVHLARHEVKDATKRANESEESLRKNFSIMMKLRNENKDLQIRNDALAMENSVLVMENSILLQNQQLKTKVRKSKGKK